MSSSLKTTFENVIQPDSPYLKLLQERGLVRRELAADELRSEPIRGDAVEQALILFALRAREERQAILSELQAAEGSDVKIAAFRGVQKQTSIDGSLHRLDAKAQDIWDRAVMPIRAAAKEISAQIAGASLAIDAKQYDDAQAILDTASNQQRALETQFQTVYSEARRTLRRDYNAEFSSRVWDEAAAKHYDTVVNRSVFVPPEEMRSAMTELSETRQQLVAEKQYATELEKRVQARPERNMSPGMKP